MPATIVYEGNQVTPRATTCEIIVKIFSSSEIIVKSPYPTVVIVAKDQERASK